MKIVMVTISKGLIARNLLQNDFYELLKKHFDKVVILTTASASQRFIDEFKAGNVCIIPLLEARDIFFGKLIANINRYIIYNDGTEMLTGHNFDRRRGISFICWRFKHLLLRLIFLPLSKIKILRRILQKIDYVFLHRETVRHYRALIKKYQPNVVFATNIMDEAEAALLKAARREKVFSLAMAKSWDNLSKKYFRARADTLLVWNQFMLKQAQKLQDYKKDEVAMVGVPQFDYYIDRSRLLSREEFCSRAGLDPKKKIIFFGSEGKLLLTDPDIVGLMRNFIKNGELADACQVFVRPHWAYTNDRAKFRDFFNVREVVVDGLHCFSSGFSDSWDYSREQMDHFFNSIYHSAVVVNTASTLTLDAIALNRPVILIQFAGHEKPLRYESVANLYTSDYYKEVLSFKAALTVDSAESLRAAIDSCLQNSDILGVERDRLKQNFFFMVDGQAGKRLFNVVYNAACRT